jgi:predicted methyltransferase
VIALPAPFLYDGRRYSAQAERIWVIEGRDTMTFRRTLLVAAVAGVVAVGACQSGMLGAAAMAPPGMMTTDTDETTAWGYMIPAGTPFNVAAAVKVEDRTEAMRERDAARKPAEVLTLAEVHEGDRIVEIASFGQYYTTMLASAVGPEGHIYMSDLPYTAARAEEPSRAFVALHPNTEYELIDYNEMVFPTDLDAVHIVLYYHDLSLNEIDIAAFNRKVYDALRPGGVYFIVDHNAPAGTGREHTQTAHRIDPAVIRDEVTAAGFTLETESDLLRHAEDDQTTMVFAPGTRGLTDRTVFVFRKPG